MSTPGDHRPYDPAGTRPKVDPESLRAPQPPPDLPWAEREARAESRLEGAIERFDEVRVEEEPGASQHLGRFQFILGGLIAVAVLAVAVIALVIVVGRTDQPDTDWSAWHPSGGDPLQQIADHVGAGYRLGNGAQIASVIGGPLQVDIGGGDKVNARVVRQDPRTQSYAIEDGKTALFTLCGSGDGCTFAGKPSQDRFLLIRREALELALYALHYTDADQVVVTFPTLATDPKSGAALAAVPSAVFLRRGDVQDALDRPLRDTLSTRTPSVGAVSRSSGIGLVEGLTAPYAYQLEPAGDLSVLFMLSDLRTAIATSTSTSASTPTPAQTTSTTPQTGSTTPQAPAPQGKTKGKSGKPGG